MTRWRPAAAEPVRVRVALEMWRLDDVVVDVRTPEEYRHGHVSGALNVPADVLLDVLDDLPPGQIIVTCSLGRRSSRVAHTVAAAGRTAYWLDGGVKAWAARGLPVTFGDEVGTRDERPRRWWRRRRGGPAPRVWR